MASLLGISEAAALGLHATGWLARHRGQVISGTALAEACGASPAHMIKVCQRLAQQGLLGVRRGRNGGFFLAKSPSSIRLLDIYVTMDGPVSLRPCLFRGHTCRGHDGHPCIFGRKVREFEAGILRYLKNTTLATIVRQCAEQEAA
jgi:Rrf2 family protein